MRAEQSTGRKLTCSARRAPQDCIIISGTIVGMSGRTLSGQTTEAFYVSMQHSEPLCIGLNCALGADQMMPFMQALSNVAECFVPSYPTRAFPTPWTATTRRLGPSPSR